MMQDTVPLGSQQQVDPNVLALLNHLNKCLAKNLTFPPPIEGLAILRSYCSSKYQNNQPFLTWHTPKSMIREGGSDPLEHIDIFKHDHTHEAPAHWHFIGYGLSDIHDYRRHYEANPEYLWEYYPPRGTKQEIEQKRPPRSGFGLELTMRVRCHETETVPPEWPRIILQNLARYIFEVRITCDIGDHIAFNQPLDGEESRIRHILMMQDPVLKTFDTPTGSVKFIQLVGVCDEELEAARQWNVMGLLEIMKERQDTGGPYMVTDMRRGSSIFQIDPSTEQRIKDGIDRMGSDMSSISTMHKYSHYKPYWYKMVEKQLACKRANDDDDDQRDSDNDCCQIEQDEQERNVEEITDDNCDDSDDQLGRGYGPSAGVERGNILDINREDFYSTNNPDLTRTPSRMSYESESDLLLQNIETGNVRYLKSVYLLISRESARIFPVVLKDRLVHRRCFTFQNYKGDLATTFVPEGCQSQTLASKEMPMVKSGPCLHIYVSDQLLELMTQTIGADFERKNVTLPKNYSWHEHDLHITVTNKIEDVNESKN